MLLKSLTIYLSIVSLFILLPLRTEASVAKRTAIITRIFGKVKILINPNINVVGPGPHALVNGKYYTVLKGRVGLKIPDQTLIQTEKAARVRIIYPNGDQFSVGSNTSYTIKTHQSSKKEQTIIQMLFGSLRATVEKGGPRKKLKLRTRTMAMGVRGTDFFVASESKNGGSSITVLRGKVAIRNKNDKEGKEVILPKGFSAKIGKSQKAASNTSQGAIVLSKTTKEKILSIHERSQVKKGSKDISSLDNKTKSLLLSLENRAIAVVMKDIKEDDPQLYKKIKKYGKAPTSLEDLQTATLKNAFEKAPKSKNLLKPKPKDLELSDEEVYEKYFKSEE